MTQPLRLGDILLQQKAVEPHQIDVALDVQRRMKLPIGQILLQTALITRTQLLLALLRQKLARFTGANTSPAMSATQAPTRPQGQTRVLADDEMQQREKLALNSQS